jgi:hypothetical protein
LIISIKEGVGNEIRTSIRKNRAIKSKKILSGRGEY